jgi:hypothetical protein
MSPTIHALTLTSSSQSLETQNLVLRELQSVVRFDGFTVVIMMSAVYLDDTDRLEESITSIIWVTRIVTSTENVL